MSSKNTYINWITTLYNDEDEWLGYEKEFAVEKEIKSARIRFESDCVCAVFLNGEFVIAGTGRYPERVNCHEVTSYLVNGENKVELRLGGHYFQPFSKSSKESRGYWLNQAAFELEVTYADGTQLIVPTNKLWKHTREVKEPVIETMQVTKAEYDTMWKNAAYWKDEELFTPQIAPEVLDIVGNEYKAHAEEKTPKTIPYNNIVETDMEETDGTYAPKEGATECYLVVGLDRLHVGYTEFDYKATSDVTVTFHSDYTESVEDFEEIEGQPSQVNRLSVVETLSSDNTFYRNMRRRAFRYTKIKFSGNLEGFSVSNMKMRLCLHPEFEKGWFKCSDEMLNKAWEMGKHTLRVNKHQEYESCPRNEMLFFAGDGAIDAFVDMYANGNQEMLRTSLSVKHEASAIGVSTYSKFNRTIWQWDYFAWRIICIYNYYKHTGDKEFLKDIYQEAKQNLLWYIERMNDENLLFQIPAFHSTFSSTLIQVDWACSRFRYGENAFLNCLLYRSLVCMAELSKVVKDKEGSGWLKLSEKVKTAINDKLWDEEKQAYVDGISDYICQDANALAIIFGVADKSRAEKALETVKNTLWSPYGSAMASEEFPRYTRLRGGNVTISPMMSAHEAEAWFMTGKYEEGLELVRRVWGTMIKKGATTFWEFTPNNEDGKWDAPCHGWSTGCTYLLSAFILGIRPDDANWRKFTFSPRPCDIEEGKGVVPTPYGYIAASWKKEGSGFNFEIAYPKALRINVDLPENSKINVVRY